VGLTHPVDLTAWQRWQDRQHPLRTLRGRLRASRPHTGILTRGSEQADLLVTIDSTSPSNVAALLRPVAFLDPARVAVLSPVDVTSLLPGSDWSSRPWTQDDDLPGIGAVLTAGHHLPLGAVGFQLARARGLPVVVPQHGLLTPLAPPLPSGALLLAWSDQDAEYWGAGRADVTARVVGSQLLWESAQTPSATVDAAAVPTYLGQLHGAELPRRSLAAAAGVFCRTTGATYRPHPSERDRRSLRQHAAWEAEGIRIDRSGVPLAQIGTPVVSVFSTGVLEAAARGIPAWVALPDPPAWLTEFWDRYEMRAWGGEPTPAPPLPETAPARLVADVIGGLG
jgi:hypothetical protein